jgi:hypothetical protein
MGDYVPHLRPVAEGDGVPPEPVREVWSELGTDADRVEFIEALQQIASAELDAKAAARQPGSSIPAGWFRMDWMNRGGGHTLRAYCIAAGGK